MSNMEIEVAKLTVLAEKSSETLAKINTVLLGNGNPEDGVVMRLSKLQVHVEHLADDQKERKRDKENIWKSKLTLACCIASSITAILIALLN